MFVPRQQSKEEYEAELVQRDLYQKQKQLQSIAAKAFREVMTKEYEMIQLYRPHLIKLDEDQTQAIDLQSKVIVDRSKLNDPEYL